MIYVNPFESWKQEGKFNENPPIHVVAFLKPSFIPQTLNGEVLAFDGASHDHLLLSPKFG
jgi:hypothetical protein